MSISKVLQATYNSRFCDTYTYEGNSIFGMSDNSIEVDNNRQRAIKVQSSDITTTKDTNGVEQLSTKEISLGTDTFKIITWQYHGNKREEIILVLEGDGRGN
ncbi:MAG: hypothetical protein M0Q19_05125 [Candidatus Cloacimonetes bacterium]|nr:hypothetical protein [Candidatus Cloacimonadota bacterium]MCK9332545.1 hypothetical protein [Candidatus Cloacimonadota bacterium]